MSKSQLPNLQTFRLNSYSPAILKRTWVGWLIEYYALHPQTQEFVRKQIKLNRIRNRFTKLSDFKAFANGMLCTINAKLAGGWSPFFQEENVRLYTPLGVVMQEYVNEKKRELRTNTMRSYESFCRIFGQWCDKNVPQIYASLFNKVLAIRYLDYFYNERKVGARAWNNQLKMGRALFAWAVQKCYVKENPFENIKTKREPAKKRILIPHETRERIAEYLLENNPPFLTVCKLVFTSLIRPKEIRFIQLKHVRLRERAIIITADNAKTHNQRYAAINGQLLDYLLDLNLDKFPQDYYLFSSDLSPGKKPCAHSRFGKEWDKLRKALQLPAEMQLYSLRDTGINNLLKAGIDPLTVMQHADHHDLSMTTRYANHADPELTRKIFENAPEF